jgi:GTPase SAR1 family protein
MATKRTQPDWSFKILLIGDSGVGKTCLMFRFAGMYFFRFDWLRVWFLHSNR